MRIFSALLGISLLLLVSGCGSPFGPGVQAASAQVGSPAVEVKDRGQWEGSFPGQPGDGVGVRLTQVGGQLFGSGIVVFKGDLVPVEVVGYIGEGPSDVFLQLYPKDHGTETDTFFLDGGLEDASPANFTDSVTKESIAFTLERSDQEPSEVSARLYDGKLDSSPDNPESYLLRIPGKDDVYVTLETAVLVAIFGSWETEGRQFRNPPLGNTFGDVRAYTFDFSPINDVVFTGPFSKGLFPDVRAEIFYNREIPNAGEVGSVYKLNSDSYRVDFSGSNFWHTSIGGATLELVSGGR